MSTSATRAGFLIGAAVTMALTGLLYLGGALIRLAFVPYDLADIAIRLTPGAVATQGIETLGAAAKLGVKLGAVLAFVLAGGALGAALGRTVDRRGLGRLPAARSTASLLLCVVLVGLPLLNPAAAPEGTLAPVPFLSLVILALAWGSAVEALLTRLPQPAAAVDAQRRTFLLTSGAAAVTLGAAGAGLATWLEADPATPPLAPATSLTREPASDEGGFVVPTGVRPRITSQAALYNVSSRIRDPRVAAADYTLTIDGAVARPLQLALTDLLALPRVEQTSTLQCVSNEVGGPLIGNCRWVGVPLAQLLGQAVVQPGALKAVLYGADGYVDTISLADALQPTTLVALGVDGQSLGRKHGYPVRLIVPNLYGMKNVKWLQRVEIVTADVQGYWQQRGWSDSAVVKTAGAIDTAGPLQLQAGMVVLGGIATAGSRGIARVELQIDGGAWRAAELEPAASPLQWRRWRYAWPATPGRHTVAVRATDGAGAVQTAERTAPHPDGASGYHTLQLTVRA